MFMFRLPFTFENRSLDYYQPARFNMGWGANLCLSRDVSKLTFYFKHVPNNGLLKDKIIFKSERIHVPSATVEFHVGHYITDLILPRCDTRKNVQYAYKTENFKDVYVNFAETIWTAFEPWVTKITNNLKDEHVPPNLLQEWLNLNKDSLPKVTNE